MKDHQVEKKVAIKYASAAPITRVHAGEGPPSRASHYRTSPYSSSFPCLSLQRNLVESFFFSLSAQHAASWNSRRRSSARHRITEHSRFRALEPKHSWGPSTECNRESVDRGSLRSFICSAEQVCKTLFQRVQEERISSRDGNNND